MPNKKALIAVTNHSKLGDSGRPTGYWLSEVSHFYWKLKEKGYEFDFVSPMGGKAPADPESLEENDPLNDSFRKTDDYQKLQKTLSPDQVNPDDYGLIYYPGGHGPMWDLAESREIAEIASQIYEQGGVVSAVCHGPAGLLPIKDSNGEPLIKARKLTGLSNLEEYLVRKAKYVPFMLETELKNSGAKYSKGFLPGLSYVVTDGRIATGQNPRSTSKLAEEVINILES